MLPTLACATGALPVADVSLAARDTIAAILMTAGRSVRDRAHDIARLHQIVFLHRGASAGTLTWGPAAASPLGVDAAVSQLPLHTRARQAAQAGVAQAPKLWARVLLPLGARQAEADDPDVGVLSSAAELAALVPLAAFLVRAGPGPASAGCFDAALRVASAHVELADQLRDSLSPALVSFTSLVDVQVRSTASCATHESGAFGLMDCVRVCA